MSDFENLLSNIQSNDGERLVVHDFELDAVRFFEHIPLLARQIIDIKHFSEFVPFSFEYYVYEVASDDFDRFYIVKRYWTSDYEVGDRQIPETRYKATLFKQHAKMTFKTFEGLGQADFFSVTMAEIRKFAEENRDQLKHYIGACEDPAYRDFLDETAKAIGLL